MQVAGLEKIGAQYSDIFLQPHFDDIALSCGGLVASRRRDNGRTLVVTIFAGRPRIRNLQSGFIIETHQAMGFQGSAADVVAARQKEDECACEALGADNCWIDLPEALYRTYEGFSELFGAIKSYDQRLTEDLAQTMNQISDQAPSARIYVPLGIGGHVDHQIVCQAILRSNVRQNNILFYEDFPYVVKSGVTPDAKRRVMAQHLEDVSDTLDTKVEAIFCYRSQINFLLSYLLQEHVEQTMQRCRLEEVLKEYSHSLAQCAMSEAHAAGVKSPSWFAERYWTL